MRLHGKVTQEWCQASNPKISPAEKQQRFPNHCHQSAFPTIRYLQRPHRISPTSGMAAQESPIQLTLYLASLSQSPKHPTPPSPILGPAPWHRAKAASCTTRVWAVEKGAFQPKLMHWLQLAGSHTGPSLPLWAGQDSQDTTALGGTMPGIPNSLSPALAPTLTGSSPAPGRALCPQPSPPPLLGQVPAPVEEAKEEWN